MLYHRFGHQSLFTLQTCRAAAFHGPGAVSSSCVRTVAHTSLSPLVTLTSLHPTHGTRLALSLLPTASWAREEISGFRTGKTPAGWTHMVIYRFPALLHTPAVNRPHCIPIPFFFQCQEVQKINSRMALYCSTHGCCSMGFPVHTESLGNPDQPTVSREDISEPVSEVNLLF